MEVGLRVVRGPDWKLNDTESDGGEGSVGTVVEVGGKSSSLPENLVWVQWDSGIRHDHRAGYYGAYDLCVLDNAQIGIKHDGIACRSCKQNPILGICWKCQDCDTNFNLCTSCYMADEHEKQHTFLRLDFPDEDGVSVGSRVGAKTIQSRGIFPGAKVVRGIDWRWKNQDGGEGKEGVVVELKNWKTSPKRGVLVSWDCSKRETYRLGVKGKVDLKCVKPGIGGFYYKDHLPKLGEWKHKLRRTETRAADVATTSSTSEKTDGNKPVVGDTVCVSLSSDIVQAMNSDIEAWTDDNKRYLGKVGTLHSVTSSGGVSILYSDKKILTFHPDLVIKADKETCEGVTDSSCKLTKGASVRITENEELLKNLQQGHGPWNESVHQARGKVGRVLDVTPTGEVEVIVRETGSENVIVFNAAALSVVEGGDSPHDEGLDEDSFEKMKCMAAAAGLGEGLIDHMFQGDGVMGHVLCGAVDAGDTDCVENILNKNPHLVNYYDEVTYAPLIRACIRGHSEVATVLLCRGADINQKDSVGFTALHHAANKDTSGTTASVLVAFGANLNCTNDGCTTPLHLAIREFNPETAKVLVKAGCNVNLLDQHGFTALHYAAHRDHCGTVAHLLIENGADVNNRRNKSCLAPIHVAVDQFNLNVVQALIQARCDVNAQCSVGSTALHKAARRGNLPAAETLLDLPTLGLTLRDREGLTSFLAAIVKRSKKIAKLIFEKSPSVASIPTNGGMTALHLAALYDDLEMIQTLLDSRKVNIDSRSKNGLTPLDLATAANRPSVVQLLRTRINGSRTPTGDQGSDLRQHNNVQSKNDEMESYSFRSGDTVKVKENLQLVEALQLCHGGWNPGMIMLLGKTGFVEEILDTGEVKMSVEEFGKTFILNPLALVPAVSEDNYSANTAENSMNNVASSSVADEVVEMDPLLEYAIISDPFLDLVHSSTDEFEHVNHVNARKILLIACKMRWFKKVQEIISFFPEAVNQKEGDKSVLHVCCFSGNFEIVMMLLEAGADLTARDHNNFTPLHTAAMGDKSGMVTDLLLKKGADPSDNDNKLCVTPLHFAVVRKSDGAAKNLAERSGTYINVQNLEGDSPLHNASDLGREEMVAMMLTVEDIDPGLFNKRGYLAIHLAAEKGYEKIVRMLVIFGKDQVNTLTRNEATMAPIHLACENGHVEVAKVLLETSVCDFRIPNGKGRTPKELAKFEDLVALLNEQEERGTIKHQQLENDLSSPNNEEMKLKEGNVGSSEDGTTNGVSEGDENVELAKDKTLGHSKLYDLKSKKKPRVLGRIGETQEIPKDRIDKLLQAVLAADVKTIETILESWSQVVNQLFSGTTLLHLASCDGFLRVLTKLIEFGANVMAKDGNGLTPLQIAAATERTGTSTRFLLDSSADPNFQSSEAKNRTALHIAVLCCNNVVVKELIMRKCNVNVKDDRGNTPMHDAIDLDNDEIASLILETPTYDPLSRNDKGLISLHKAALKGKKFLLKRMLVRSPNIVNEPTPEGNTAIHLAAANGSPEIAKILIEEGRCRLDVWNSNNETPCKVALSGGHKELARLLWGEHDNVENKKEEPSDSEPIQRTQGTFRTRREGNTIEAGRREGPMADLDDIPDRLLCCICLDKQKNIAFQCGHMNTCEECAKKITECPECKAVIKSRLTTYY